MLSNSSSVPLTILIVKHYLCFGYTGHLGCVWAFKQEPILSKRFLSLFLPVLMFRLYSHNFCSCLVWNMHLHVSLTIYFSLVSGRIPGFCRQTFYWSHCTFAMWFIRFVVLLLFCFYFYWAHLFAALIAFMVCNWYVFWLHMSVCRDIWYYSQPLLWVF